MLFAGERRLLSEVQVSVTFDPETGFDVEPAGWWVVNYPLEWISSAQGRSADEIAMTLFGKPAGEVEGFKYSKAMKAADITWTREHLDAWLAESTS